MVYLLTAIGILAFVLYFSLRKKKQVTETEIQEGAVFRKILQEKVHYYINLAPAEKERFELMILDFLKYVRIEGVSTTVTDLDRVLIASSAIIPIFGLGNWEYRNITNVVLYPDTFDGNFQFEGEDRSILGMVGSGFMNGQMILSRLALQKGFSSSAGKENAAIHEFVHLIDKSDGSIDGLPENLLGHQYSIPWLHLMHQEMHRIEEGKSDINPYALTNEAEFFAVAAEYFFEKPEQFKTKHEELYLRLSQVFRQNP